MADTPVTIINMAIARQNGNAITTLADTSKEGVLFANNYEQIVKTALSGPSWKFASRQTLLVDAASDPIDTDWLYTLTLPSGVLYLRSLIRNGLIIDYERASATTVLTDFNDDVYANQTYRADDDVWPADFKEGIICRCEALVCRAYERQAIADLRDKAADELFARARRSHAAEETPTDPYAYPLIAARMTGYASSRR